MKITRRQLKRIIKEELLRETFQPRESPLSQDPGRYDFASSRMNNVNIVGQWISLSGIPGGMGEEQWGFMKIRRDEKVIYGNPGNTTVVNVSRLETDAPSDRADLEFEEGEFELSKLQRSGDQLRVAGRAQVLGRMQGDENEYRNIKSPGAIEAVRSMMTQLYRSGRAEITLVREPQGRPERLITGGDVIITLTMGPGPAVG